MLTKCSSHCFFVVDHFRNAAGEWTMQWCRYVTDFFWSQLEFNRISRFMMNILVLGVRQLFCGGSWCCCGTKNFFYAFSACEAGPDSPFTSISKSEDSPPIWRRCSLQYFFYYFKSFVSPNRSRSTSTALNVCNNFSFCQTSFFRCLWRQLLVVVSFSTHVVVLTCE
jgi:hypothetical protein